MYREVILNVRVRYTSLCTKKMDFEMLSDIQLTKAMQNKDDRIFQKREIFFRYAKSCPPVLLPRRQLLRCVHSECGLN